MLFPLIRSILSAERKSSISISEAIVTLPPDFQISKPVGDSLAVKRANLVDAAWYLADGSLAATIGECGYGNARQTLDDDNVGI